MTYPDDALCRDYDPEIFFPLGETEAVITEATKAAERKAQAVCAWCPVKRACLSDALSRQEPFGVWGGTTVRERREMSARKASARPVIWLKQRITGLSCERAA